MSVVRISVITPTFNRERHLRNLVGCFQSQTYPDLELLILDDSAQPSALMSAGNVDDPRIRYLHSGARMSIGAKRNRLIEESRGEVIVQFDDDDYYSPRYVETMVRQLEGHDLVKLGGWFGYSCASERFFYWDTATVLPIHFEVSPAARLLPVALAGNVNEAEFIDKNLWGYGFSYVVRKRVFEKVRFGDENWGEDYSLVQQVRRNGFRTSHLADAEGLALHVIHASNTSRMFPQYLIPGPVAGHLFGDAVTPYLRV